MTAQPFLVGRTSAFAQLYAALERAQQGKRQVVFVTGAAGMGKSALVGRFLRDVAARHLAVVAWGQCVEQRGTREAFLPILDALGRLGLSSLGAPLRPVLARHAPLWLAQIPALLAPGEGESLARALLGASQERMLREMAGALEILTREMTLVLCIDDLHWGDPSSLDLLALLARRIERARLLLIVTSRTPEQLEPGNPLSDVHQDLLARGLCQRIALEMLTQDEVAEYLGDRLGATALDPGLTAWIYERSEGQPLFLVNLMDYLLQRGWLQREPGDGSWRLAVPPGEQERAVPEGLAALIDRQLASVSIEAREVLEAASVAGQNFGAVAVAAGLGVSLEDVERQLDGLAREQRLVGESFGVEEWPDGQIGGRYRFLHALYRDAVLDRMTAARRVRLHRRIGHAKEQAWAGRSGEIAGELAVHFGEGRDVQRAVSYALEAGTAAQARGAHREAVRHHRLGLELVPQLPASPEGARDRIQLALQTALGGALMNSDGYSAPDVVETYERAHAIASRLPQQVRTSADLAPVLGGLVSFYHARSELEIARDLGGQLLELAEATGDARIHCQANMLLGGVLHSAGEVLPALEHLADGLEHYDPASHLAYVSVYGGADPGVNLLVWSALALCQLGYIERGLETSEHLLELARRLDHPFSLVWALVGRTTVHTYRGELDEASEHIENACARAEHEHFPFLLGLARLRRLGVLLDRIPLADLVREAEHALRVYEATGARALRPAAYGYVALAHARAGDRETARAWVERGLAQIEAHGERCYQPDLERLRGLLVASRGPDRDGEDAATFLQRSHDLAQRMGCYGWQLNAACDLARLLDARGKRDAAIAILARVAAIEDHELGAEQLAPLRDLLARWGDSGDGLAHGAATTPRPSRELLERLSRAGRKIVARAGRAGSEGETGAARMRGSHVPGDQAQHAPVPILATPAAANPEPADAALWREGEYWTLVFAGVTCRLQHSQGLGHLARLLAAPGESLSALELVAAAEGLPVPAAHAAPADLQSIAMTPYGDTGELLDRRARSEYERRLRELREDLAEAEARNDPGHAERAREEMEILLGELSRATGLGGRARPTGAAAERARVNVTRAIRSAVRKIAEHHPEAGDHLQSSVRTGAQCSYAPAGSLRVRWEV